MIAHDVAIKLSLSSKVVLVKTFGVCEDLVNMGGKSHKTMYLITKI